MPDADATREDAPNSFVAILANLKKGRTERELSEALQKLVAAVTETGKPGSITVKLDLKAAKDVPGMVVLTDSVAVKVPHHDRKAEMFFATDAGQLSKDDPRQTSLFPKENTSR